MADLYWNPPSVPANFSGGANWRVGSVSGPVHGATPTASDSVSFNNTGSPAQCTFDMNVSVIDFFASDFSGDFVLAPAFVNAIQITVTGSFGITSGTGTGIKLFFSLWSTVNDAPVVTIRSLPAPSGTVVFFTSDTQMGTIFVDGSPSGNTSLAASSFDPFKCYLLRVDSGTVTFDPANCNGASLGLPTNTNPSRDAVVFGGSVPRTLDAQFPDTKPITLYGNFNASGGTVDYQLIWGAYTRIYAKGAVSQLTIRAAPYVLLGVQQVKQLPFIYNYLGEDASGLPIGGGGTVVLSADVGFLTGACRVNVLGLICTAEGSVTTQLFARSVHIHSASNKATEIELFRSSAPAVTFVMAGAPTAQVLFRSQNLAFPAGFKYFNNTIPDQRVAQTTYTTLTGINAIPSSSTLYAAYTSNGNIDGGGNTNWQFQASNGFLAFFS